MSPATRSLSPATQMVFVGSKDLSCGASLAANLSSPATKMFFAGDNDHRSRPQNCFSSIFIAGDKNLSPGGEDLRRRRGRSWLPATNIFFACDKDFRCRLRRSSLPVGKIFVAGDNIILPRLRRRFWSPATKIFVAGEGDLGKPSIIKHTMIPCPRTTTTSIQAI